MYPVCIRRETSPNPNRTPHVTRPFNIYKEGQGSPKRDKLERTSYKQEETILGLDTKRRAGLRRLPRDDNET